MGRLRDALRQGTRLLRDESGQSILMLLLIAAGMLFFLNLMYQAGGFMVMKMRLQNVADVSAMAGATFQAQRMQQIANLNKDIVDLVVEANRDAFESHAPFPTDAAAKLYIEQTYLTKIQQRVNQIRNLQRNNVRLPEDAARIVATKNLDRATLVWHSPRLNDPRAGGEVVVALKDLKNATFNYVRKNESDLLPVRKSFNAPAYFDGKTNDVVYTAVQVRIDNLSLGNALFTSRVTSLAAYAAAKPWGGKIRGTNFIYPFLRIGLPPMATAQTMPSWNALLNIGHNPLDYDVWLVSVGSNKLKPRPVGIPDQPRFLH